MESTNRSHKILIAPSYNPPPIDDNDTTSSIDSTVIETSIDANRDTITDDIIPKKSKEYLKFCIGFSLSLAPAAATVVFAPSFLSPRIGGIGNACFFLVQAFFSALFAKGIVTSLGSKKAILYGSLGNIFYSAAFSVISTHKSYFICFPIVSAIGGISQSIMWTAQV
jgi:hypothetical protein